MIGDLTGRVALVTGGGRGIGREHALLLAAHGARIVVNDVGGDDGDAASAVAVEIAAAGGEAVANTDSVTQFDAAQHMVDQALETFGDLHVVVNNAGILRDRMLVSMTEAEFDDVVDVHLKGTFNVSRHAAAYWRTVSKAGDAGDRAIVNTSSGAGLHGNPGQTSYAAAKAGIASMTIVHAMELRRYGVRVNCIAPIARTRLTMATPGIDELMSDARFDPGNVSPLVVYLASPGCPFTGQVFSVYGGAVGIYQGWSIHDEVTTTGRWTVDELAVAMESFPRRVETRSQNAVLTTGVT